MDYTKATEMNFERDAYKLLGIELVSAVLACGAFYLFKKYWPKPDNEVSSVSIRKPKK